MFGIIYYPKNSYSIINRGCKQEKNSKEVEEDMADKEVIESAVSKLPPPVEDHDDRIVYPFVGLYIFPRVRYFL